MTLRLLTIVGARPQFVKAAALSRALERYGFEEIMVHTGQHFDANMSDVFFDELCIPPPQYNLGVHGGGHGEMTGRILQAIEPVMTSEKPDAVIVYGDTNSTLASALCAAKLGIPLVHVEAGLRSFNRRMPEEINRVVVDHLSSVLLCPTPLSVRNLATEGVTRGVHHVGDVMYDVALHMAAQAEQRSSILQSLDLVPRGYSVATVHRPENTDDPAQLSRILAWLGEQRAQGPVIMPVHPRTRLAIRQGGLATYGLRLIDPLGYLDMTSLVRNAAGVLTDSGGLQKEAYFHRVPCVTLRATTEWAETIEAGWNRLWQVSEFVTPRRNVDDYGDGRAAERVADILADMRG